MRLMTLGPVLVKGRGGVGDKAAGVGCDPCAAMEDLDGGACSAPPIADPRADTARCSNAVRSRRDNRY